MSSRTSFFCLLLSALLIVTGCHYDVYRHYPTRADAELRQLFLKGWLPAIIPLSSYGITTKNDLDLNISVWDFYFRPSERSNFVAHLAALPKDNPHFRSRSKYGSYYYKDQDTEWIFYIHRHNGHCEYRMQLLESYSKSYLDQ